MAGASAFDLGNAAQSRDPDDRAFRAEPYCVGGGVGDADGIAAAVQLADLIVHHAAGDRVSASSLLSAAERVGLDESGLRALLFEYPHSGEHPRRASEPCPLSAREVDALRGLAAGKVYKQIAQELQLSVSTIRTHLHNVYKKIGAVDRAQAVLIARERGWI